MPRNDAVPARAAAEFLRHRGYIEDEAAEVIEILAAREAIVVDRHGIRLLKDDASSRAWLLQRISTLRSELLTLGIEPQLGSTADGTSADMRQTATSLEEQLKERVEELSLEVAEAEDELTSLIGEVVASSVSKDWLTSDLSTQLRGAALLLERHRNDLVSGLRKELKRVQAEVQRTSCRTTTI